MELKQGLSRMSAREFSSRYLQECATSHNNTRIKGSMISILERNWFDGTDFPLKVKIREKLIPVSKNWTLVVREKAAAKWASSFKPALSSRCKLVVFEELVRCYGSATDFNILVQELVSGDYYHEWINT